MSEMTEAEKIQITADNLDKLKFNKEGLIPAIVQDIENSEVLMMAYMNPDSLKETSKSARPASGRVLARNIGSKGRPQAISKPLRTFIMIATATPF